MNKYLAAFFLFISVSTASLAQNIGGIGAQLFLDTTGGHSMPQIQGLVPHTPADQYLKATDYIIKVNDIGCLDRTLADVVSFIRGEAGTIVKITVADTKDGKRPRDYNLVRTTIPPIAGVASSPDPATVFNTLCENEVTQIKKEGLSVVKTFPSDCGNYFFNFDAESALYHIRVIVMTEKSNDTVTKAFYLTARAFDNANETAATQINAYTIKDGGNFNVGRLDGAVTFNKPAVGAVNVQMHGELNKCRSMYVVIYK